MCSPISYLLSTSVKLIQLGKPNFPAGLPVKHFLRSHLQVMPLPLSQPPYHSFLSICVLRSRLSPKLMCVTNMLFNS